MKTQDKHKFYVLYEVYVEGWGGYQRRWESFLKKEYADNWVSCTKDNTNFKNIIGPLFYENNLTESPVSASILP